MADVDPFATATELLADLRAGRVGSRELTDLYIRRIERHDGRLNAVVVRDFERARQRALAVDEAAARGERAALLGLPITLKESINVAGLETTCGVPEWKGYVSLHDAPAAARLRAAGTVLLGKTNVPPALADWQSANPIYGRTGNPWDAGRSPGGSSGGGAAALAAGLTALEVGSDIGGSHPRAGSVLRRLRPSAERDSPCRRAGSSPCRRSPTPPLSWACRGRSAGARRISSWRYRSWPGPTWARTSPSGWSCRPRAASGSPTSGWPSCRRSRGSAWTVRSWKRSTIWPLGSAGWGAPSSRRSPRAWATTASITACTGHSCPR